MWSNRNSHLLPVEMRNGTATLEDSLVVSLKLNIVLAYDPAVALPGTYPKALTTHVHIKTTLYL